jgi:hypothetical protein
MEKTARKQATEGWRGELDTLLEKLVGPSEIYFPIRHHSPACSLHLARLIEAKQPATVLVEGPQSLEEYIPELAKPDLVAPVALYAQYVDRKGHTADSKAPQGLPARFASYYPLCDYSPELVAIREGTRIGAKVVFCDLDYAQQAIAVRAAERDDDRASTSLFDERRLAHSRYLGLLAQRSGCRDTNELWDRLFESAFARLDNVAFVRQVGAYCYMARVDAIEEELRADGTLAREACMRDRIQAERSLLRRRKETRPLLVVAGGFHVPALVVKPPDVRADKAPKVKIDEADVLHAIIPYSFQQLDALNGYSAGMPSPNYYQRLWETVRDDGEVDLERVSRAFLVDLPQKTREAKLPQPLSTADVIAAHQQACNLARFRGNPGPMREDLLDGIRSSFVKGSLDAEGESVLAIARALLCGDAVGRLPKGTRTHPLLEDFRTQAERLGLGLDSTSPRSVALSIYEKEKHRRTSAFFHSLDFLAVPFARFVAGPDFVGSRNLALRIEHWEYAWSPQTDSALIDLAPRGTSVQEAVVNTLLERQAAIEAGGATQGSVEAVGLLLVCCRLGLHDQGQGFMPFVFEHIHNEASFDACVQSAMLLHRLHRFAGPLETRRLEGLPDVFRAAYSRACFLLDSLSTLPEESLAGALASLSVLRELAVGSENAELLDAELLWDSADKASRKTGLAPSLSGGLLGLLLAGGRRSREDLLGAIEAQEVSRDDKGICLGRFLLGLFTLCRELSWNDDALMERIGRCVEAWADDEFFRSLPDLRLAFAQHTPQETDRVGKLVARLGSVESLGEWYRRDIDEAFAVRCAQVAARAAESLKRDCLEEF